MVYRYLRTLQASRLAYKKVINRVALNYAASHLSENLYAIFIIFLSLGELFFSRCFLFANLFILYQLHWIYRFTLTFHIHIYTFHITTAYSLYRDKIKLYTFCTLKTTTETIRTDLCHSHARILFVYCCDVWLRYNNAYVCIKSNVRDSVPLILSGLWVKQCYFNNGGV